jgi:hypothetical protein
MKTTQRLMLITLLVALLASITYSQPYEPEHLWHRCGYRVYGWFGKDAAGIGDVNGDGCEDFIVSTETFNNPDGGYAALFYGGDPPDTTADIIFNNPYPYGFFGRQIENIGDVNNDEWDDFTIMGGYSQDNMTRVFINFGGDQIDTIPDVVLSEVVFDDAYGVNIEGVGDVNNDGYDDVAVFATNYGSGRGKVWIYLGGSLMDSIADWEQEGCGHNAHYGRSIAGKGDLNGDGYDDFAIFEWTGYPNLAQTTFYIYFGSEQLDTIPDVIIDGETYYPDFSFTEPMAMIPNLNGDPYSDLVLTAGRTMNSAVFHGGNPMDTDIDLVLDDYDPNPPGYGMNVSVAGDINRDGYDDIISAQIDAYGYGGLVLVHLGSPWMTGERDMEWMGIMTPWDGCGTTLVDCGDINGDGVDDIMFGSYEMDFNPNGCLDIWLGDTAFVVDVPIETLELVPNEFYLHSPYPNPFNSSVMIPFEIFDGVRGDISLIIYNVLGRMVMDLRPQVRDAMSRQPSGPYEVAWNGKDNHGKNCSSGVYVIILQWGVHRQLRKVVMLR